MNSKFSMKTAAVVIFISLIAPVAAASQDEDHAAVLDTIDVLTAPLDEARRAFENAVSAATGWPTPPPWSTIPVEDPIFDPRMLTNIAEADAVAVDRALTASANLATAAFGVVEAVNRTIQDALGVELRTQSQRSLRASTTPYSIAAVLNVSDSANLQASRAMMFAAACAFTTHANRGDESRPRAHFLLLTIADIVNKIAVANVRTGLVAAIYMPVPRRSR